MSIEATHKLSTTTETKTPWQPPINRGENVVKNTHDYQGSTDSLVATPRLSKEEIVFSRLVAQGYSYTTAYRMSYPSKRKLSYGTIRRYAHELVTKENIQSEVATVKLTTARLARLAEDRIEQILVHDDSQRRGNKVAEVAMFMYDHANGKATQRQEIISKSVSVNIDLTQPLTEVDK